MIMQGMTAIASDPIEAVEIVKVEYACDAAAVVGDIVVPSTTAGKVDHLSSNVYSDLVFGVICAKLTSTLCEVLILGQLDIYGGLTPGKRVFVDTDGTPTTTKPITGHLQVIGRAVTASKILVNISNDKVIQT